MAESGLCWNCGNPLAPGARFCAKCGSQTDAGPRAGQNDEPTPRPQPTPEQTATATEPSKPGSKTFIWAAGGIGLAIVLFMIFWGGGNGATTTTTTTGTAATTTTTGTGATTTTTGTGATTTTTLGTGGTRGPEDEDTDNLNLRDLVRQEVGEFSLDSVAPFPQLIANGALEALTTSYKDAAGTVLIHQLSLWETEDRAVGGFDPFIENLEGDGYEVVTDGDWSLDGEIIGRKVVAQREGVEVVFWTNGRAVFFIWGPIEIADEFWSQLPY